MALTSDELTICNQALDLIGQPAIDSSDTTDSQTGTDGEPYAKLERAFDQTRDALQRSFEWNFARARLDLVTSWDDDTDYTTDMYVWVSSVLYKCNTAHTSTTWSTDYVMDGSDYVKDGSDYVRDDSVTFYWDMVTDRPETYWTYRYDLPANFKRFDPEWLKKNEYRYRIEQGKVLTNETELDINYIKQVTDPTEFDDLYTEVLIFDIALKMTYAIMGASYQAQAFRRSLREQRNDIIANAKAVNSIESDQGRRPSTEWVNVRYGSGIV